MADHEYGFRDLAGLMTEIASHCPLTPGLALLAVVEDPLRRQRLVHLERLPVDSRLSDGEDVSDLLHDTLQLLPLPDCPDPSPRPAVLTVVVRTGFTLIGRHEQAWCMGWRHSNHGVRADTDHLAVVTEHGWYELLSRWAGSEPAMLAG